jgi:hypothetical protein
MVVRHDSSQLPALRTELTELSPGSGRLSAGDRATGDQQAKVIVGATCWRPRDDLDAAEWILLGRRLGTISRGVAWWLGDWVNYGNAAFGEKYSRAARVTGYDVQSLMNMAYVASRFDYARRREGLSWSHHAELAALAIEYQDSWLDNAELKHLSVRGLRDAIRAWRADQLRMTSAEVRSQDLIGSAQDESAASASGAAVCPQCGFHLEAKENRD